MSNFTLRPAKVVIDHDVPLLPNEVKPELDTYLDGLKTVGPKIGTKLEDRHGCDLSMCWKIVFCKGQYRIVYRLDADDPSVIEIIGITKRADDTYKIMLKRTEE